MLIPYRLDPAALAVVAALAAIAFIGFRREERYAEGFVQGLVSKNGHRPHSVTPIRGLRP